MKTPRTKKTRKSKAVHEAEARVKIIKEQVDAGGSNGLRESARDQIRTQVAALIMTARARLAEVAGALRAVNTECNDPSSFLNGLLGERNNGTLANAVRTIDEAEADLSCLVVGQKELPDFLAVAKGYADNWKL